MLDLDQAPFVKHQTHYFPDGNIILVAETTLFRFYRGILESHSEMMRDMFTLCSNAVSSANGIDIDAGGADDLPQTYDSVPVIRLHDSPEDVIHLLRTILPHLANFTDNLNMLDSVGRLANKYMFHKLEAWTKAQVITRYSWTYQRIKEDPSLVVLPDWEDSVKLLHLCNTLGCAEAIPLVFFDLAWYRTPKRHDIKHRLQTLRSDDIALLMVGQAQIQGLCNRIATRWSEGANYSSCKGSREKCALKGWCILAQGKIQLWCDAAEGKGNSGLCASCDKFLAGHCETALQELVKKIPQFFAPI